MGLTKEEKVLEMLQEEVRKSKEGKPQHKLNDFDQGFNEGLIYAKQKVASLIRKLANPETETPMTVEDVKDVADRLLETQPHRICPGCKHSWVPEAIYCGYCGERLGKIVPRTSWRREK